MLKKGRRLEVRPHSGSAMYQNEMKVDVFSKRTGGQTVKISNIQ